MPTTRLIVIGSFESQRPNLTRRYWRLRASGLREQPIPHKATHINRMAEIGRFISPHYATAGSKTQNSPEVPVFARKLQSLTPMLVVHYLFLISYGESLVAPDLLI